MKILVLGRGYLGREFERQGFEVWGRDRVDFKDNSIIPTDLPMLKQYDVIVNCISKSGTRWCEDINNFNEAISVNSFIPMRLNLWCTQNKKKFVHISTGCLYDRTDIINTETDFTAAHCNYTITKWVVEKYLDPNECLILRPRLLFDNSNDIKNLLFRLSNFKVFTQDEKDSFTSTKTLVEATKVLIEKNAVGVFNVAQEGYASIYQIAGWCNIDPRVGISAAELRKQEKLYLVNNRMSIDKLKQYYQPAKLKETIIQNYKEMKRT